MESLNNKYILFVILFISYVFSISLVFYPGAYDVNYWMKWMGNISKFGLIKGYIANNDMYPPFATGVFYLIIKLSRMIGIDQFLCFKLTLFMFLISTSIMIFIWTKNLLISISSQLIFSLISMSLGYIDILTAPFILLSLFSLQKKRYLLFTFFYFVNVMIKWQGLIMVPFILVYLLNISSFKEIKTIDWKKILNKIALPSIILLILTFLVFSYEVYYAFSRALNNNFLSDTINFNWIVTRGLYLIGNYKLSYGVMEAITIKKGGEIDLVMSATFWLLYISCLISFIKDEKNFLNLLKYSVVGYFAYFLFNIGIHENHLFVAALLSLVIIAFDPKYLGLTIGINLILNICLFFWFEVDGKQDFIDGIFLTEISVILALLFTILFAFVYFPVIKNLKESFLSKRLRIK